MRRAIEKFYAGFTLGRGDSDLQYDGHVGEMSGALIPARVQTQARKTIIMLDASWSVWFFRWRGFFA